MNEPILKTDRLLLRAGTPKSMSAAADDDREALGQALSCRISGDWPPRIDDDGRMAREGFKFVRDVLVRHPDLAGWWGWWVILMQPAPTLIGAVSPKGPPDREGTVEIAYGIVDSQQGKGYATEATLALIDWLKTDRRVRKIVAETFPNLPGSIAVMEKCGLAFLGEGSEPGTVRYGIQV